MRSSSILPSPSVAILAVAIAVHPSSRIVMLTWLRGKLIGARMDLTLADRIALLPGRSGLAVGFDPFTG